MRFPGTIATGAPTIRLVTGKLTKLSLVNRLNAASGGEFS